MTSEALTVEIESCSDCPHFKEVPVQHWLAGHQTLYEYQCTEARRVITPDDGVNPPPKWCPLRNSLNG